MAVNGKQMPILFGFYWPKKNPAINSTSKCMCAPLENQMDGLQWQRCPIKNPFAQNNNENCLFLSNGNKR